jgi:hypothetical protein
MIIMIVIERIIFFEKRGFVRNKSEDESLILIIIIIEGIMFFEGKGIVRDRFENKLLILIIIMIEGIIFVVFSSENIRDLIISIIMDLTSSIISFLIASGRYKG